jgi:hypothetical protein
MYTGEWTSCIFLYKNFLFSLNGLWNLSFAEKNLFIFTKLEVLLKPLVKVEIESSS